MDKTLIKKVASQANIGRRQPGCYVDIDLDLVDLMLDLEPAALAWTGPQDHSSAEAAPRAAG